MSDRYTHGHHESVLRSHRWRTAENSAGFVLDLLEPTTWLLDVGCGPGTITADLARRIPAGAVVGIDRAPAVVADARAAFATSTHPTLHFEVGDVYALPFADATFDVVFAHQVLQHLADPVRALREMRRVLRPEGWLAVRDADYGAFVWYPGDPVLEEWRAVYHDVARANGAEADGGRRLPGWVRAAGATDLRVSSSNWTYASDDERQWWGGLWADRVRVSDFAHQAVEIGAATSEDLERFARAFRRWTEAPDGVFLVVNVEVLARRGA